MAESPETGWFSETADGFRLHIRLTPKSSRDDLNGVAMADDGHRHLRARVRAVPEKGKANRALIALVATRCGVPKSSVQLIAGETSRLKALEIAGRNGALKLRLLKLAGQRPNR